MVIHSPRPRVVDRCDKCRTPKRTTGRPAAAARTCATETTKTSIIPLPHHSTLPVVIWRPYRVSRWSTVIDKQTPPPTSRNLRPSLVFGSASFCTRYSAFFSTAHGPPRPNVICSDRFMNKWAEYKCQHNVADGQDRLRTGAYKITSTDAKWHGSTIISSRRVWKASHRHCSVPKNRSCDCRANVASISYVNCV